MRNLCHNYQLAIIDSILLERKNHVGRTFRHLMKKKEWQRLEVIREKMEKIG